MRSLTNDVVDLAVFLPGFPRTKEECEALNTASAIDKVIYLKTGDKECVAARDIACVPFALRSRGRLNATSQMSSGSDFSSLALELCLTGAIHLLCSWSQLRSECEAHSVVF